MDVCFNCGCSLVGEISGQHAGHEGWLCLRCLISFLGLPARNNKSYLKGGFPGKSGESGSRQGRKMIARHLAGK